MKNIIIILTVQFILLLCPCEGEESQGKWALSTEQLNNRESISDQSLIKATSALIDKKWPSATIEFWNDRGVSWDIHVVYLKITSKETVRLLCISFENQTKETKIEKELFITNGIASVKKISTEDMGKIAGLFREITEVSGYIPAFVCFPGEDEKDTDDLPEGTWSYVIGEKINVDRSKGLSQAAVYISKDFKVIDHKIVGSIE